MSCVQLSWRHIQSKIFIGSPASGGLILESIVRPMNTTHRLSKVMYHYYSWGGFKCLTTVHRVLLLVYVLGLSMLEWVPLTQPLHEHTSFDCISLINSHSHLNMLVNWDSQLVHPTIILVCRVGSAHKSPTHLISLVCNNIVQVECGIWFFTCSIKISIFKEGRPPTMPWALGHQKGCVWTNIGHLCRAVPKLQSPQGKWFNNCVGQSNFDIIELSKTFTQNVMWVGAFWMSLWRDCWIYQEYWCSRRERCHCGKQLEQEVVMHGRPPTLVLTQMCLSFEPQEKGKGGYWNGC